MAATTGNGIEAAMDRIAGMLGGPPPATGGAASPGSGAAVAVSGGAAGSLTAAQQQAIATQIFYSMQVPPITPADLMAMERELPALVDLLHSLGSRPAAAAELTTMIAAMQQAAGGAGRAAPDPQALNALAEAITQDAFGDGSNERFLPVVVAGLAFFMAGYTIAHGWGT
jgi:hypothetical protein